MIDLGSATGLTCRECSATYDLGAAYACMECFGPLEVTYDLTVAARHRGPMPACLWPAVLYALILGLHVTVPGRWVTGPPTKPRDQ